MGVTLADKVKKWQKVSLNKITKEMKNQYSKDIAAFIRRLKRLSEEAMRMFVLSGFTNRKYNLISSYAIMCYYGSEFVFETRAENRSRDMWEYRGSTYNAHKILEHIKSYLKSYPKKRKGGRKVFTFFVIIGMPYGSVLRAKENITIEVDAAMRHLLMTERRNERTTTPLVNVEKIITEFKKPNVWK